MPDSGATLQDFLPDAQLSHTVLLDAQLYHTACLVRSSTNGLRANSTALSQAAYNNQLCRRHRFLCILMLRTFSISTAITTLASKMFAMRMNETKKME